MNFLQFREASLRLSQAAARFSAKPAQEATANELLARGDYRGAEVAIKDLLQQFPGEANWWHELASIQLRAQETEASIESWRRALLGNLTDLDLLCKICDGMALAGCEPSSFVSTVWTAAEIQGQVARQSKADLRCATLRAPSLSVAAGNLSSALPAFQSQWQSSRGSTIASRNLAFLLRRLGDEGQAECVMASHSLESGAHHDSVRQFESAPALNAESEVFFGDYLHALRLAGKNERVFELASRAEQRRMCTRDAYYEWAHALSDVNRVHEAVEVLGRGAATHDDWLLRVQALTILPPVALSQRQLEQDHQRVSDALSALVSSPDQVERFFSGCDPKALQPNFHLAYAGNAIVDEVTNYGVLTEGVMSRAFPHYRKKLPRRDRGAGQRVRVGYVSGNAYFHSNMKLRACWMQEHDRENIEVHLFPLNGVSDWMTDYMARHVDVFHPHTADTETAASQILESKLDVLVYLEVGMSPLAFRLAALRLAPVQCSTWGHPVTSGLSTIDYFLSSEAMEPANGAMHYTEQLVTQPGIGVCAPLPGPPEVRVSRSDFDLHEGDVVYLSPQSTFKYLPEHDDVFAQIARHVGNSVFVFIESQFPAWSETFSDRLRRTFVENDLSPGRHLKFLPSQGYDSFLALNRCSDIFVDSIGWSGCNTTLEALSCGLPVVTMPGDLMRARHSYAMLTEMDIPETIAASRDEYIQIAVRLGLDSGWREQVSQKIGQRIHMIANDARSTRGLEAFYRWAVGSPGPHDHALFKVWPRASPAGQMRPNGSNLE